MSKQVGQRRSVRRDALLAVLTSAACAMTPDEIQKEAAKAVPGLGIATVYRNIKLLLDAGMVAQVILPDGQSRYEYAGKKHHHHFHCRDCGQAFCIDGCALATVPNANLPKGFRVDGHEITFYGQCPKCSK